MAIINTNKTLHAEAVYFKGQPDPIRNCVVFLLDPFVIIARDQHDTQPDWYNVQLIERMEKVTAEEIRTRIG